MQVSGVSYSNPKAVGFGKTSQVKASKVVGQTLSEIATKLKDASQDAMRKTLPINYEKVFVGNTSFTRPRIDFPEIGYF